jgi:transposase-like protein
MAISSSKSLFPIRLKPQEDELFTSWISRIAIAHGLSGNSLITIILDPKVLRGKRDIDRINDKSLFAEVSSRTGIATERIYDTSLYSYEGYLFSESHSVDRTPWILPFWSSLINQFYGIQFCWQCLREDANPYFRKKWRLSFIVNCVAHKIVLSNKCPGCSNPICYFWLPEKQNIVPVYICNICNFDLRTPVTQTESSMPSSFEIEFQEHLEHVLDTGWVENKIGSTYSHLYFDGLYLIMRSLSSKQGKRLCEIAAKFYKIGEFSSDFFDTSKNIERRLLTDRRLLNKLMGHLIANWHEDFVDLCKDNQIHLTDLVPFQTDYVPFWCWRILNEYMIYPRYTCSDLEIESLYKYVKSQGNQLNSQKVKQQFGDAYYSELIRKRKLISYKKNESRRCVYCQSTKNQRRAFAVNSKTQNNPRYYCTICKVFYTPNHLSTHSKYSIKTREATLKLIKEGVNHLEIAKTLSVAQSYVKYWHKKLCIYCNDVRTQRTGQTSAEFNFYCKICKQSYIPRPYVKRVKLSVKNPRGSKEVD